MSWTAFMTIYFIVITKPVVNWLTQDMVSKSPQNLFCEPDKTQQPFWPLLRQSDATSKSIKHFSVPCSHQDLICYLNISWMSPEYKARSWRFLICLFYNLSHSCRSGGCCMLLSHRWWSINANFRHALSACSNSKTDAAIDCFPPKLFSTQRCFIYPEFMTKWTLCVSLRNDASHVVLSCYLRSACCYQL